MGYWTELIDREHSVTSPSTKNGAENYEIWIKQDVGKGDETRSRDVYFSIWRRHITTASLGFHQKIVNSTYVKMEEEEILAVGYEDGEWHKPYYDCGGGNIWMMTYTVPFFGYNHTTNMYYFK